MKRGGSNGGGQSSLGYLFGSDKKQKDEVAPPSPTVCMPPYGIDTDNDKPPETRSTSQHKSNASTNDYPRVHGQNSGNLTGRPSTKVKSAPGGVSSLGYLFGDN